MATNENPCADCGEMVKANQLIFMDVENKRICEGCLEDSYGECVICGQMVHTDCLCKKIGGDEFACEDCAGY